MLASFGNHDETSYVCVAYITNNTCYVKSLGKNAKPIYWFAITTAQQWGKGKTGTNITYPVAFGTAYCVTAFPGTEAINRYENCRVASFNTTTFQATMTWSTQTTLYWIAIGK